MRNFKKRTIALVLASVVTVAGSFASERFKNSLMNINFETAENGSVSMVVQTQKGYSGSLNTIRRDANTYILTLPEVDSKAPTPDLTKSPQIQSVNIRTMPYTNNSSGYTRITIKTNNLQSLPVQHKIFLPDKDYERRIKQQKELNQEILRREQEREQERLNELKRLEEERQKITQFSQEKIQNFEENTKKENITSEKPTENNINTKPVDTIVIHSKQTSKEENNEAFLLVLGVFLVLLVAAYCYVKAKDKLIELSGESIKIDIQEDENVKKREKATKQATKSKKINQIKSTIKKLDTTYSKSAIVQSKKNLAQPSISKIENKTIKEENIVDLDKLFQEQIQSQKPEQIASNKEIEENAALEDFLSGFSFDEEFGLEEDVQESYNVELFEQIINGDFKFSKDDIECINKLMQTEINDETIRNIDSYLVSNPIQKSKNKILEEIMTTYAISQNITFDQETSNTLYKLINLEIDPDFITDLRTNPERTKEAQKEILESKNKIRKPSEIATLKVSNALPDLSEALKKQGNNKIRSEYKAETVYFSEGYEVSTLSVNPNLPDLSKELGNKDAYISQPSEKIELVDSSYKVKTLSISGDLPDLSKILQDPQSFKEKEEETVVADEKTLLENISKVEFKPFDDNSQNFEVLNDFDDFYAVDDSNPNDVLSFEEIAAEFKELYNEQIEHNQEEKNDSNTKSEQEKELIEQELASFFGDNSFLTKPEQKENVKSERSRSQASEDILNRINERRNQRKENISIKQTAKKTNITKKEDKNENQIKLCVIENESFDILSSVSFINNMGCHLAKNSKGYSVIGYIGDKLFKIKTYPELKSEKIQARMSEKGDNGNPRYIVRIGIHKFILEIENENIRFIMDLC